MFDFEKIFADFFGVEIHLDDPFFDKTDIGEHAYIKPSDRTYEISQKISQRDDEFSAEAMIKYAEMVFREVHKAVTYEDLEPVRDLVSPRLYKLLQNLISDDKVDAIEEYSFNSEIENNYLTQYKIDDKFKYEYMTVCIIMTMPPYNRTYINKLTFRREANKSIRIGIPVTRAISCPNCGAALESIATTKCVYCGSTITPAKYEWELQDFEIVKR